MTDLRQAAQQVLDRWDSPLSEYAASDLFEELRIALEQPEKEPLSEVLLTDKIVERAGREWWAQTRHTNGPRTLSAYASQAIMDEVHDTARIILTAAIEAAHGIGEKP